MATPWSLLPPLCLCCWSACLVAATAWPFKDVTVSTSFGPLIGQEAVTDSHCERWLGVPYAKAPVGGRRFAAPEKWDEAYPKGGRHAKKHGSVCPQGGGKNSSVTGKEDCLFLNIWRPKTSAKDLAVMIWIHGGGFISGAGDSAMPGPTPAWLSNSYDGCAMASKQDVIVVSINYRLSHVGFAAFESADGLSTNFGFADQQEAFRWLQHELHAFGGDASKVTIFGESAGGDSVLLHGASPRSKGLFRAGIAESGMLAVASRSDALAQTERWARRAGCGEKAQMRECMLNKTLMELANADTEMEFNPFATPPWAPVIDGVNLDAHPFMLYKQGRVNPVPIMAGTNTNDSNFFVYLYYNSSLSDARYREFADNLLGQFKGVPKLSASQMERLYKLYPPAPSGQDNRAIASEMANDAIFTCSTRSIAKGVSAMSDPSFFLYRFDHRSGCFDGILKMVKFYLPGVFHASEIAYVFDTPATLLCLWSKEERQLSSRMQAMWANFAKGLQPSQVDGVGNNSFPAYADSTRRSLVLGTPSDVLEQDYRREQCEFWDEAVYSQYGKEGAQTFMV